MIPDIVPKELRQVMWDITDGPCGILKCWNKYCPNNAKYSKLFWKSVLEKIFKDQGINPSTVKDLIQFILDSFTIMLVEDQDVFEIHAKKNRDGKRLLDEDKLKKIRERSWIC